MSVTLFVPCDSAALAAGADEVVDALHKEATARGVAIDVQRNSSRGMFWLEPLVEVVTPQGRMAYGPVAFEDVPSLFDADFLTGGKHALGLGLTDAIPYLAKQQRLTFARMGITRPLSLDDYAAHGGWVGLKNAVAMDGAAVVQELLDSGLRGRGGAAFPAGIKWRTVRGTTAAQKYVVCNADEGDSGTFSDRMTMEGDPYMLIEGMAIDTEIGLFAMKRDAIQRELQSYKDANMEIHTIQMSPLALANYLIYDQLKKDPPSGKLEDDDGSASSPRCIAALDVGADAILVSNHGGRQLDGALSTIRSLPQVVRAVGDQMEVYLDGGIRSGQDVLKALAMGAQSTFIGRSYLYGLGAMGQAGVTSALQVIQKEIDITMALCGVQHAREFSREHVLVPEGFEGRWE